VGSLCLIFMTLLIMPWIGYVVINICLYYISWGILHGLFVYVIFTDWAKWTCVGVCCFTLLYGLIKKDGPYIFVSLFFISWSIIEVFIDINAELYITLILMPVSLFIYKEAFEYNMDNSIDAFSFFFSLFTFILFLVPLWAMVFRFIEYLFDMGECKTHAECQGW
jgi:hypothetical protein